MIAFSPMTTTRPKPTFEVLFTGRGVSPSVVSISMLARTLEAVQSLVDNRPEEDPFSQQESSEQPIDSTYGQKYSVEVPQVGGATHGGIASHTVSDKVVKDSYAFPLNSVDSITVTSHAIQIYDDYGTTFFHSYMPYHYGGPALNTPEDQGALFINFALFPRSYQPSGHFNMSRARETFIGLTTSPKQGALVSQGTCGNAFMTLHENVNLPSPCMIGLAF